MFVTILTIIYLALAIFILIRFFRKSIHVDAWTGSLKMKMNKIFVRKSEIDKSEIDERTVEEKQFQPEFRS